MSFGIFCRGESNSLILVLEWIDTFITNMNISWFRGTIKSLGVFVSLLNCTIWFVFVDVMPSIGGLIFTAGFFIGLLNMR